MLTYRSGWFFLLIFHFSLCKTSAQRFMPRFEHYSLEDGISDLRISASIQDHQGFLWFGTEDGLNRYDGYEFKVYRHDPDDPTSLAPGIVLSLMADSEGRIWVGADHLCRYDPASDAFVHYINDSDDYGSSARDITRLAETLDGYIWAGTHGHGLYRLDTVSKQFKHFSFVPEGPTYHQHSDTVMMIYEDQQANLWVGSGYIFDPSKGGLHRYDPQSETFTTYRHDPADPHSLQYNAIASAFEDSRGNFWVGTFGGALHLMDREKGTFTRFPYDPRHQEQFSSPSSPYTNSINAINEDPYGRLWIAGGTLVVYDPASDKTYRFQPDVKDPSSLSSWWIWSVFFDHSGNAWLSDGYTAFLDKTDIRPTIFTEYTEIPGDPSSIQGELIFDVINSEEKGLIWVGTNKGLNLFDPTNGKLVDFRPVDNGVRAICSDGAGGIWYGNWVSVLGHYDPKKQTYNPLPNPYQHTNDPQKDFVLNILYWSRDHILWAGTFDDGLFRFDPTENRFIRYPATGRGFNVSAILEDRKGRLWIGTVNSGLFIYEPETDQLVPVLDAKVHSILEDRRGQLWLGTDQSGLWLFDGESAPLKTYKIEDGLASNTVFSIVEDQSGSLWLATGRKISKFDPDTEQFLNFNERHGLRHRFTMLTDKSGILGPDGNAYFGAYGGMTEVFTREIPEVIATRPRVVITGITTPDTALSLSYRPQQQLKFPYHQNTLSFDYVGLHYTNPAQNRYQYKLENVDEDWVSAGTARRARYSDLDPDTYTFRVKAASSEGLWSEKIAAQTFTIYPPWWRTGWAYAGYTLLLLAVLLMARRQIIQRERLKNRLKLEQLEREKVEEIDQLRTRFFANISHEFRTPLTLIKAPLEDLLTSRRDDSERLAFLQMHQNTERLLHLVHQLLDLSRLESGALNLHTTEIDVNALLRQLAASFQSLADQKQLQLKIDVPETPLHLEVDQDKFEKMTLNLLSNAVKFAPENGWVQLKVAYTDHLRIEIGNDGTPIPPEEQTQIFGRFYQAGDTRHQGAGIGLALVRELVDLHEGKISVSSTADRGTWFVLELPLKKTEAPALTATISSVSLPQPDLPIDQPEPPVKSTNRPLSERPLLLLVEDHHEVRHYIRSKLTDHYRITEAENGRQGLELAIEQLPDLIISDVMMPEMDGISFCQKIKTDHRTDHIPVILLTAKADVDSRLSGLETGADDYLAKPFDSRELLVRSRNLIEQRERLRAALQKNTRSFTDSLEISSAEEQFLKCALELVETHLEDADFSTEDFAKSMQLSRTQLHRKLKTITGMSATDFVRNLRLEHAALLLGKNSDTVSQIAYRVGFNNLSYFAKCFREKYGVAPSGYQKQYFKA